MSMVFFCNCTENKSKNDTTDDSSIVTIEKHIDPCRHPRASNITIDNKIYEYEVPGLLINYLDSIVSEEFDCMCYEKGVSGFYVVFYNRENDILEIRITPVINLFINDYNVFSGFFVYKHHVFIFNGDTDDLGIKKKKLFQFKTAKPMPYYSDIDDSKTLWYFRFHHKKLLSVDHVRCQ